MRATVLSIDKPEFKTGESRNSKTGATFQWTIAQITAKDAEGNIRKFVSTFDKVEVGEEGELGSKQNGEYTNYTFTKDKNVGTEEDTKPAPQDKSTELLKRMADAIKQLKEDVKILQDEVEKLKSSKDTVAPSGDVVATDVSDDEDVKAALDALDF